MENPTFKTSRPRNNEVCKSIAPHPFEKIDGFPLLSPAIQKNLRQISLDQIELLLPIVKQKILDIKKTVENAREKTKEGAQKKKSRPGAGNSEWENNKQGQFPPLR